MSNHPRVTVEQINAKIVDEKYHRLNEVLTVCVLTLENGFSVRGESACVSPENYNKELGEKYSREDAFNKIWALEGYLLKEKIFQESKIKTEKSLGNTDANGTKKNVSDVQFFGNGDLFQLICKASSKNEKWMKSTKAMEVNGGCVVQVTTQQGEHVAESITFVPNVKVVTEKDKEGKVIQRFLA